MNRNKLLQFASSQFESIYGKKPTCAAYAPGRVNIIGEHTDYNGGLVMPCAIDYGTVVVGTFNSDNVFRFRSYNIPYAQEELDLSTPITRYENSWTNYLRGVIKVFLAKGITLRGMDIFVYGDIPHGAGLSSSASLEVSFAAFINGVFDLNFTQSDLALIAQRAEHFAGCNCGIMDQMVSSCAKEGNLLKLDCETLNIEYIPFLADLDIMIINSAVKHDLVEGEYNQRRKECENAAKIMNLKNLSKASLDDLAKNKDKLSAQEFKRARHVITENARCLATVKALKEGDFASLATTLRASHNSLRDDYEVSIEEIDFLVDTIYKFGSGKAAARITGGGFGGCVVALVQKGYAEQLHREVIEAYKEKYGIDAEVYFTKAANGAQYLPITKL